LLRGFLTIVLALAALGFANIASARPATARIVVLAHDGSVPELTQKVRAELSAMGLVVTELVREAQPSPAELLAIGAQARAVAALLCSGVGVELWVVDPPSGEPGYHEQLRLSETNTAEALGLRASEVVRAQLTRLQLSASKQLPQRPVHSPTQPKKSSPESWFGLGPGVSRSVSQRSRTVALMPHAGLAVLVQPVPVLRFGAFGLASVAPRQLQVPAGAIDVSVSMAAIFCEVPLTEAAVGVAFGGGGGLVFTTLKGRGVASAGYQGRKAELTTGMLFSHFSILGRLSQSWRLRANSRLGVAAPRIAIESVGETVATWGQPFFLQTLELEVKLP